MKMMAPIRVMMDLVMPSSPVFILMYICSAEIIAMIAAKAYAR